ncbi:MAG TPA: hypothetical protein VFQ45_18360 [Longimicrobium sp.]|nr:hypothetical protein [Longimicrobium sp.]
MDEQAWARMAADWMRHARRGEWEEAWTISDTLLRSRGGASCRHWPRHEQWVWDGTPLGGRRVLVRCYHGLGDTLQFIRYAPLVQRTAAEAVYRVQPKLIPLLRTVRGIGRLLPLHDGAPEVEHDVDVELMELAHVFRTTLATIPRDVPYLHVDPAPLPRTGRLAAGIVWRSGEWDERRSIPFPLLAPLREIGGVDWFVFQGGPGLEEWDGSFGTHPGAADLLHEARLLRSLDVIVTVDTMTAHLAGALAVPVWTLLQAEADWRWMEGRGDSPWYPTMRLFRQEQAGDWEPVVARVAAELRALAARRTV